MWRFNWTEISQLILNIFTFTLIRICSEHQDAEDGDDGVHRDRLIGGLVGVSNACLERNDGLYKDISFILKSISSSDPAHAPLLLSPWSSADAFLAVHIGRLCASPLLRLVCWAAAQM